ncbi:hypothetical protein [Methylobacterium goesingense]|uniref:AraC-like DNA-binding protein n=1 Tax=Methylobacterium goesingense TaxID=243690 RepID=A0ABV2LBY2_9HYPH|nr:hypothetical protein [Methylobacterium goesingense]GJD73872.1 hypothetical protein CFIICLFH_2102 [Methylobacterium goesingense]
MTFEEQAVELLKLEALAKRLGISTTTFERILIDVTEEAQNSTMQRSAAKTLAEIRRRIEPPGARKPGGH